MNVVAPLTLVIACSCAALAYGDSAKPANPSAYGDVVQFGARQDHDLFPGPGNTIGDVRSNIAKNSDTRGVAPFVESVKETFGSTPNPPGRN